MEEGPDCWGSGDFADGRKRRGALWKGHGAESMRARDSADAAPGGDRIDGAEVEKFDRLAEEWWDPRAP